MAKGRIVQKTGIKRKKGYLYFVDADGNIRESKMQVGSKRGRRTCRKPAKTAKKRTSKRKK